MCYVGYIIHDCYVHDLAKPVNRSLSRMQFRLTATTNRRCTLNVDMGAAIPNPTLRCSIKSYAIEMGSRKCKKGRSEQLRSRTMHCFVNSKHILEIQTFGVLKFGHHRLKKKKKESTDRNTHIMTKKTRRHIQ